MEIIIDLVDKTKSSGEIINSIIETVYKEEYFNPDTQKVELRDRIFNSLDEIFNFISSLTYENEKVVNFYKYNTYYENTPLEETSIENRNIEVNFKLNKYNKKVYFFFDKDSILNKEINGEIKTSLKFIKEGD